MNCKENRWTLQELRDLERANTFIEEGRRILRSIETGHSAHAIHMRLVRLRKARAAAVKGGDE